MADLNLALGRAGYEDVAELYALLKKVAQNLNAIKAIGSDSGVTTVDDVKSAFAVLSEISIES